MCFNSDSLKIIEKPGHARRCNSAAKRSIMLPRAPMPFWHIVKVVCSSVYQIKILGGRVSLVCHLFHP